MQLDYYVYNGIHEAADAFQRLALIFGDNSFLVFVGIFALIGVMAGGLLAAHKGLTGQQGNPLTWAIPILFGLILFKAFVIPTGTLHIYDPVKNAYQPVDDVPDIVILLAGGLNRVERGIVDIVDTASAFPYADGAGSLRFTLLLAALNAPEIDVNLSRSIERYFADCGTYAIATNRDGVSLQELKRNTADLRTTFAKFAHGGLFTVYYPPGNDGGDPMTCAAAWDQLSTRLNNQNNYLELRKGACDTAGFNSDISTQLQRCDQLLEEAANIYSAYGSVVGLYTLLSNIVLARSTANALSNSEYAMNQRDSIARQNFVQSLNASESLAQWVPKLRGFMVATIVGLVPLVLLLIVTPLIGRAIALICGMFVWLTLWGITDAVAAQMAADAATRSFANLKSFGLGYDAIINSPQAAIEAQGLFGKARSMALMLATFLAAALFKFGGYAFTHVAQGWQDSLQGGEGGRAGSGSGAGGGSGNGQQLNEENFPGMSAMGMFGSSPAMAAAGGKATPQTLSAGAMREAMVNDSLAGMQPAGRSFVAGHDGGLLAAASTGAEKAAISEAAAPSSATAGSAVGAGSASVAGAVPARPDSRRNKNMALDQFGLGGVGQSGSMPSSSVDQSLSMHEPATGTSSINETEQLNAQSQGTLDERFAYSYLRSVGVPDEVARLKAKEVTAAGVKRDANVKGGPDSWVQLAVADTTHELNVTPAGGGVRTVLSDSHAGGNFDRFSNSASQESAPMRGRLASTPAQPKNIASGNSQSEQLQEAQDFREALLQTLNRHRAQIAADSESNVPALQEAAFMPDSFRVKAVDDVISAKLAMMARLGGKLGLERIGSLFDADSDSVETDPAIPHINVPPVGGQQGSLEESSKLERLTEAVINEIRNLSDSDVLDLRAGFASGYTGAEDFFEWLERASGIKGNAAQDNAFFESELLGAAGDIAEQNPEIRHKILDHITDESWGYYVGRAAGSTAFSVSAKNTMPGRGGKLASPLFAVAGWLGAATDAAHQVHELSSVRGAEIDVEAQGEFIISMFYSGAGDFDARAIVGVEATAAAAGRLPKEGQMADDIRSKREMILKALDAGDYDAINMEYMKLLSSTGGV